MRYKIYDNWVSAYVAHPDAREVYSLCKCDLFFIMYFKIIMLERETKYHLMNKEKADVRSFCEAENIIWIIL
jgi:hypothetical protein